MQIQQAYRNHPVCYRDGWEPLVLGIFIALRPYPPLALNEGQLSRARNPLHVPCQEAYGEPCCIRADALRFHNTSVGCISWGLPHPKLVILTRCHTESQGSPRRGITCFPRSLPRGLGKEKGLFNTSQKTLHTAGSASSRRTSRSGPNTKCLSATFVCVTLLHAFPLGSWLFIPYF